jgi:hypothetical protein
MLITQLISLIREHRYAIGSEIEFQNGMARVLESNALSVEREKDLGKEYGRIDFYLPGANIGIELKVKGGPSEVIRQVHRYAQCPAINALILVTGRARLASLPDTINGKQIVKVTLWEGLL